MLRHEHDKRHTGCMLKHGMGTTTKGKHADAFTAAEAVAARMTTAPDDDMLQRILHERLSVFLTRTEHQRAQRLLATWCRPWTTSGPTPCVPSQPPLRRTAFFTSPVCEAHDLTNHPESPARARVIRERLARDLPSLVVISNIDPVTAVQLQRFHTPTHVERILGAFADVQAGTTPLVELDGDTAIMAGTPTAALTAAGAVCQAIDLVMDKNSPVVNAFCGVRPPGHHAEPDAAMGFCLFNNVGIGACHLLARHAERIRKVLILDFDVHHGNGTQAKFATNHPNVCFISTHQGQFYPGTGLATERGSHANVLNVPLVARSSSKLYRRIFEERVLPEMHAFAPDFILISAGFDAHRLDPLADIALETDDYYWITKHVTDVAWKYAQGRIVSTLEGGYHLEALAASASAHVRAMVEGAVSPKSHTPDHGADSIDALTSAFAVATTVHDRREELRLTIQYERKEKTVVLKERALKALLQQCKNKFNLRKKTAGLTLHDPHGVVVTEAMLLTMAPDHRLYLR